MIRLDTMAGALMALVLVMLSAFFYGRSVGAASVDAAHKEKLVALERRVTGYAIKAAEDALAIAALEAEAVALGERLEAEAYEDDDAGRPAFNAGSVRRIFSR